MKIDKTAVIHREAKLADDVEIGPFTTIGKNVAIKSGAKIGSRVSIEGWTEIGKGCRIFNGAVIGSISQDLKYKGEKTKVIIGDNNIIREYVTINLGSSEKNPTIVGNNNLIMAYAHLAHDCIVGSDVILANVATLAGHVTVEDRAVIGGLTAVHQFCRIGTLSITGGCSKIVQDIVPYSMADGHPAKVYGLNVVGLKRAKIPSFRRLELKKAFKYLFKSELPTNNSLKKIKKELPSSSEISCLIKFVKQSKRGISK
ncbi:MAG: acyl-ACP--UDP-N-acetylglucosamine O-acyltransferase [Candidatus Omnitrophota bacterium]|nr:acyl-ACP--UDP-N-acetylglucosamine O-acyltransferase [Candidatus Omnitrophota bacterium]